MVKNWQKLYVKHVDFEEFETIMNDITDRFTDANYVQVIQTKNGYLIELWKMT